jgi:hypothetical protein
MTCEKCGTQTTRRTHDGPKPKRTVWYAWYFHCPACGWLYMPKDAVRPAKTTTPKGATQECHQCHAKSGNDQKLRTHKCHEANTKTDREMERGGGHHGLLRSWLGH